MLVRLPAHTQEPVMQITTLLTSQRDPADGRLDTSSAPALKPGWARFAVRRVSITTNNVTYALFGDRMSYWLG